MPRLRQRAKKADSRVIEKLRTVVLPGSPWGTTTRQEDGYFDVYGLVGGHSFGFASYYCDEGDDESKRALWDALKDDILAEHAKYRPGTRPAAWWKWEAARAASSCGARY